MKPIVVWWLHGAGSLALAYMKVLAYTGTHEVVPVLCSKPDTTVLAHAAGPSVDYAPTLKKLALKPIHMNMSFSEARQSVLTSWGPVIELAGLDVMEQQRMLDWRTYSPNGGRTVLECPLISAGKPYAWVLAEVMDKHGIPVTDEMRGRPLKQMSQW